jgi:hypothetical protein
MKLGLVIGGRFKNQVSVDPGLEIGSVNAIEPCLYPLDDSPSPSWSRQSLQKL